MTTQPETLLRQPETITFRENGYLYILTRVTDRGPTAQQPRFMGYEGYALKSVTKLKRNPKLNTQ